MKQGTALGKEIDPNNPWNMTGKEFDPTKSGVSFLLLLNKVWGKWSKCLMEKTWSMGVASMIVDYLGAKSLQLSTMNHVLMFMSN